ncbi:hypothetical protein [Mycobacteroides abscessus]|uniref:hypothetical protein n=1 Tax=Mycobacteroides abscessus TaxID=36809 RepID=UPI000C265CA5|nr:hypothetical protein [Mycobacteroides abscessus]
MDSGAARELKGLREQNARLKRLLANADLGKDALCGAVLMLSYGREHTAHYGGFDISAVAEKCMDTVMRAAMWALGRDVGDFLFHRAPYLIVIMVAACGLWWLMRRSRRPRSRT